MGVLPLQFRPGETADTLGLAGTERLTIRGLDALTPRQHLTVEVQRAEGGGTTFEVAARLDTPVELNYYRNGGILHTVLRKMLTS
jgi:aconitate hydratase